MCETGGHDRTRGNDLGTAGAFSDGSNYAYGREGIRNELSSLLADYTARQLWDLWKERRSRAISNTRIVRSYPKAHR